MNDNQDEIQQKSVFVDDKTQENLNTPLPDPQAAKQKNQDFLNLVIGLINDGTIDLYQPSTLLNREIYDGLSEIDQGKIDLEAMTLLASIREIKGLYDAGFSDSYQINNLVERVRNAKERVETEGGDVFII